MRNARSTGMQRCGGTRWPVALLESTTLQVPAFSRLEYSRSPAPATTLAARTASQSTAASRGCTSGCEPSFSAHAAAAVVVYDTSANWVTGSSDSLHACIVACSVSTSALRCFVAAHAKARADSGGLIQHPSKAGARPSGRHHGSWGRLAASGRSRLDSLPI